MKVLARIGLPFLALLGMVAGDYAGAACALGLLLLVELARSERRAMSAEIDHLERLVDRTKKPKGPPPLDRLYTPME